MPSAFRNVAEHVGVGGEDQRLEARGLGARDDAFGDLAVLHHVELHPQPATGLLGEAFDVHRGHRAHAERDARRSGCLRQHDVAVATKDAVHAGRRDDHRRLDFGTEERRAVVARRRIDERRRDEAILLEGRPVVTERGLVFGAAFHVLENEVRQAAARDVAQMADVERA
jgi:hypothetical protein